MNTTDLDLSILKAILSDKKIAIDFAYECDSKLFSTDLWNFANVILSYVKSFKEIPTLRILTEKASKTNVGMKAEYITEIWKQLERYSYDIKEYKYDLQKFKDNYANRELQQLTEKLNKSKDAGTNFEASQQLANIQKTVSNIKSLNQVRSYERKTLKDSISEFRDEYNAKLNDPGFDSGVLTGYSFLDSSTGGLNPGELLIVAGESNSGKSMVLLNLSLQMWLQQNTNLEQTGEFSKGYNVLYFSLEMPFKPCRNRVYARLANVPSKRIREAKLRKEDSKKLSAALKFIDNYPQTFEIIDIPRGATVEQIEAIMEEAAIYYKPDIVSVDYLSLLGGKDDEEDWLRLANITGQLHELARVHNCIVLTATQLNRMKSNSKDVEDKVGMHRIGRSAGIMTHANVAIQIETRPNEKQFPDMLCHIIKNREGQLSKGKLIKNLANGTLLDYPSAENDEPGLEFKDYDDISEEIELLEL